MSAADLRAEVERLHDESQPHVMARLLAAAEARGWQAGVAEGREALEARRDVLIAQIESRGWRNAVAALLDKATVEKAARALHEHDRLELLNEPEFDALIHEEDRESYRAVTREMLAAAADFLESTGGQP